MKKGLAAEAAQGVVTHGPTVEAFTTGIKILDPENTALIV